VHQGIKKTGPTIRELQEEYGGAGKFYIPEEEHYLLENEDWRYDKWPEFFMGKNVADFYHKDIEEKLNALEEEENKILEMEIERKALLDSSDDEDGITKADLDDCIKKVKGKITIIKHRSKMKAKQRASSRIRDLNEMTEELEDRGFNVNKESLATRVKNPRRIADLEDAADQKAKEALGLSDDSDDDDDVEDDEMLKASEGEKRGRKGRDAEKSKKKDKKTMLGKRKRNAASDEDMDMVSVGSDQIDQEVRGSLGKNRKSMTPSQRKISVQKTIRDSTNSRRSGHEPKRLDYKIVPEEQIRLAKKISNMWKNTIQRSEADREVTIKMPKHLYSGKMSNGSKDWR
jgi:hypothetical protein